LPPPAADLPPGDSTMCCPEACFGCWFLSSVLWWYLP
jgi:hypothetical protein